MLLSYQFDQQLRVYIFRRNGGFGTLVVVECYVIILVDSIQVIPLFIGTSTHHHFIIWGCKDLELKKHSTGFGLKVRSGNSLLQDRTPQLDDSNKCSFHEWGC